MKKIFGTAAALIISAATLSQFISCEKYILPELRLSPDTLIFEAQGGRDSIDVFSNVQWLVKLDDFPEWLRCGTDVSQGNDRIIFVAEPDSTGERTAEIFIKSETIEKKLTIIQNSPERASGNR